MSDAPLRVIFVGGYTRSGSTLLDRLLGSLPGVCAVGEFRHVWRMGLLENRFCGCGTPFRDCAFWRAVLAHAFGGAADLDPAAMQREEEALLKARYFAGLVDRRLLPASLRAARRRWIERRQRLFAAIATVSGATTIVDSSKNPSYGLLLADTPGLDVRTIHLVRDSRATSYSWTRVKADPRFAGQVHYFPRRSPAVSATWWMVNGLLMEVASRARRGSLRVRYEDLARDPGQTVARIAAFAGLPERRLPAREAWVELGPQHSVGGNPMRFEHGAIRIEPDTAWQRQMPWWSKAAATACSWPLLWRYGYLGPGARCA